MRSLLFGLLGCCLLGCNEPAPCDPVPAGTCLNVELQSAAAAGERIEGAHFTIEGDGEFRHEADFVATAGGQLLPVFLPLVLPDAAMRSIRISADAMAGGKIILRGVRPVADLVPGARRLIWIPLSDPGVRGGGAL